MTIDEGMHGHDGHSSGSADVHDLDLARRDQLVERAAPDREELRRFQNREQQRRA